METITSRQNPLMSQIRKLASSRRCREETGLYLGDGVKLLEEALRWGGALGGGGRALRRRQPLRLPRVA